MIEKSGDMTNDAIPHTVQALQAFLLRSRSWSPDTSYIFHHDHPLVQEKRLDATSKSTTKWMVLYSWIRYASALFGMYAF